MAYPHEIRDPIHVFIRLDDAEREILNSRPLQRLRQVHQLAMTYLVYPSATHMRFEHSLGVLELATRLFDVITDPSNLGTAAGQFRELADQDVRTYWRRVIRMAALCHDVGHLPFSHAAEDVLLPPGHNHEMISAALIASSDMADIFKSVTPPLRPEDVLKIAVGPAKAKGATFTSWQILLSDLITGEAFGADRMDYLLRDSYHAGVGYGKFDHYRLIDTLRILVGPSVGGEADAEAALGVNAGGVRSAEALLLARQFMYSEVYFHPVRLIYDLHLQDFLKTWLPGSVFPIDPDEHLKLTDNEVNVAISWAARDSTAPGHDPAVRIVEHRHFKVLYERSQADVKQNRDSGSAIATAAAAEFGADNVRHARKTDVGGAVIFPVEERDGRIASSIEVSEVLQKLPAFTREYVFIEPGLRPAAQQWLNKNRGDIIKPKES